MRVGFLAEYDALPGLGHACGHNLIAAAAIGAGIAVGRLVDLLGGEILVFGTPAEETIGGKVILAGRGVFDGLDAAMMVHPGSEHRVFTNSLACRSVQVEFHGKPAHAVDTHQVRARLEGSVGLDRDHLAGHDIANRPGHSTFSESTIGIRKTGGQG